MLISHWLKSLRNRLHFSSQSRLARRRRQRVAPKNLTASVESLEERVLLAGPQLVNITTNVGTPNVEGLQAQDDQILEVAPRELMFRFSPGQTIDPGTLEGISIIRSNFDGEFVNDFVKVDIGSAIIGEQPNEVILRFANTLPDDHYQITIAGTGLGPLENTQNEPFNDGLSDRVVRFELDLGAQVEAVVHQPVVRNQRLTVTNAAQLTDGALLTVLAGGRALTFEFDEAATPGLTDPTSGNIAIAFTAGDSASTVASAIATALTTAANANGPAFGITASVNGASVNIEGAAFSPVITPDSVADAALDVADGALEQRENLINVYFNANDPLDPASAQSPAFYRLIRTDGSVLLPTSVIYNADNATATLDFGAPLSIGTYNLRIGESFETNSIIDTAINLGARFASSILLDNRSSTNAFIGGNPASTTLDANDVDVYRVEVSTGTITATVTARDTAIRVRLFNVNGVELTSALIAANSTGGFPPFDISGLGTEFFIGISSEGNNSYNVVNGSGAAGGSGTGSYRLDVDVSRALINSDDNTTYNTATNLGNLGTAGQNVAAVITAQPGLRPPEPGGNDEPGHRDIPGDAAPGLFPPVGTEGENHISNFGQFGRGQELYLANGITTIAFTFDLQNSYGVDPQGNALFNAINLEQQQRTREIFELYSLIAGVQFVETESRAEAGAQGLPVFTVVTGDLRALDPTVPTGPGGVAGIAGNGIAIMDAGENFSPTDNQYGQSWMRIAMHEIGHLLGLGHSYDLSAIMGGSLGGEEVFPGDHDITHMRRLFPRDSVDIDLYQFNLTEAGIVTIETIAERLATASQLNTVLTLYQETMENGTPVRRVISRNDDYFGNDSFINLRLEAGTYFVGVSSVGNENYDPDVLNSGAEGTTDGNYELRLDIQPDARAAIVDVDNPPATGPNTAIDGDADGRAGGTFDFSFQVGQTVFVDKTATVQNGSISGATNTSPIVITSANHGLATGQQIQITGVMGNTNANGVFTITVLNQNAFSLNGQAGNGAYTGGGTWSVAIGPQGSLSNPYTEIDQALDAARALRAIPGGDPVIVRILGNSGADGQLATVGDNAAYEIGQNDSFVPLEDGKTFDVPGGVTVVIDAGAILKLQDANVNAGTFAQGVPEGNGAVQILGTTHNDVILTSWHNDAIGGDSDGVHPGPSAGDWGGVVFREDSDFEYDFSTSQTQTAVFFGNVLNYDFSVFPAPSSFHTATLTFTAFADLSAADEFLTVDIEGIGPVNLFVVGGSDSQRVTATITLTQAQLALLDDDGLIRVTVTPSAGMEDLPLLQEFLNVELAFSSEVPIFLNTVNHATISFGGGPVEVDSFEQDFDPIHVFDSRPTLSFNTITFSANAAISANPNSFNDTFDNPRLYDHFLDRLGPDIHGNTLFGNSVNGLRIRTQLQGGVPLEKLEVPARFTSTDIVHVITENLQIDGAAGGLIVNPGADPDITSDDFITKRTPGRLLIDPGVIVKLSGSRIELERGGSNFIAEGSPSDPIIFTSIADDTFGAGGTFDTNNDSTIFGMGAGGGSSTSGTGGSGTNTVPGGGTTLAFGEDQNLGSGATPAVINAALATFHGADGVGKDGTLAKLGWNLNVLYHEHQAYVAAGRIEEFAPSQSFIRTVGENAVIDLSAATGNVAALRNEIQTRGYQILAEAGSVITVLVSVDSLDDLVTLQHARVINPVYASMRNVGATDSQADVSMNADDARMLFNVDGQGITIGVLSDSFDTSGNGSYATDQATGDLPGPGNSLGNTTPVNVIQDLSGGTIDEGRAMLQLIHDVAPGADLAFATAFVSQAGFASNIRALRDAGSDVIVDDIIFFAEPMFQDGLVAQAVDEVVGDDVAYFSAAGNSARQSYESAFVASGAAGPGGVGMLHDFDPGAGVDTMQQFILAPGDSILLALQWDEAFGSLGSAGSTSDVDLLIFDSAGVVVQALSSIGNNVGGDPFEITGFTNIGPTASTFSIGFHLVSGTAPGILKYVEFRGANVTEFTTNSATSYGHANAVGAQAVGAAFYLGTPEFGTSPPQLEPFSSAGGIDILFDTLGNRLTTPEVRQTPDIVAPDGTNTTFFGQDAEGDGFPNFFGTSAAAPHAAAVAVLMLEAAGGSGSLTPAEIYSTLESTAIDMGVTGFDDDSGFGLINALPAVAAVGPQLPLGRQPVAGDWGGIIFSAASNGNLDYVEVRYGGGVTPIQGGFATFNPIEIIQADVRISNSEFEDNADGVDGTLTTNADRNGRARNAEATIYVRGAQPVIVTNVFENNAGNVISVNANAMQAEVNPDQGRATGLLFSQPFFGNPDEFLVTTEYARNFGPLVRNNRITGNETNGMEVRGATLTTETLWDDVDIVHVLRQEIIIPNLHTFGGLRLQSSTRESLVVKLAGGNAGFTAGGLGTNPLVDIDDRVGGTLEIIGTPGRPVVLTSLFDDTVGAGFQPNGFPLTETVSSVTLPQPGDWRSVLLDQYSNDRNVALVNEFERATGQDPDSNAIPGNGGNAQVLGELAPRILSADDNRRAGFEIQGAINLDRSIDQDIYSFRAQTGTEVWFDIDRTAGALDTVLELINSSGTVLASSDDSQVNATLGGTALPMRKDERLGGDFYTVNPKDAGMRVILPGSAGNLNTYFIRVRSVGGLTAGEYQLQIRLQQRDEHPGSTVTFSDIRFATNGIEVRGLPHHSPLTGEAGEGAGNNNDRNNADVLGNLLGSDLTAFGVSGNLSPASDLDFYQFDITYQGIQQIAGVNGPGDVANGFSTIFDIDYADGIARANTAVYVFDGAGRLVLVGTDSNVADDQPGPLAGSNLTDPSRGTVGKLDPFIGSVELPEGTYYAVVTANANLPNVLNQYLVANSAANLIRLEPVDSIARIAEDHINSQGGMTFQDPDTLTQLIDTSDTNFDTSNPNVIRPTSSFVPWHLGDVSLFFSQNSGTTTRFFTVDPFTGAQETHLGNRGGANTDVQDIAIRRRDNLTGNNFYDGDLVGFTIGGTDADSGNLIHFDSGDSSLISRVDDGIETYVTGPTRANNGNGVGIQFDAITFSDGNADGEGIGSGSSTDIFAVGTRFGYDDGNPMTPGTTVRNVLFWFNTSGTAKSADNGPTNGNRTGNAVDDPPAGTQVVPRGAFDTTLDARPPVAGGSPVMVVPDATNAAGDLISDEDRFSINGLGNQYRMDSGPEFTLSVNTAMGQFIQDGVTFTLMVGGTPTTYEYDTGQGLLLTALITGADINDGDTFILDPAIGPPITFEFNKGGGAGGVAINIANGDSPTAIATAIVNAINGVFIPGVTASFLIDTNGDARISMTNVDNLDTTGTPALTTFGQQGVTTVGNVAISVEETFTAFDLGQATAAVVNPLDAQGNVQGYAFNRLNFPTFDSFVGMTMGDARGVFTQRASVGGVSGGATEVDFYADDTAAEIATRIATVVNLSFPATASGNNVQLTGGDNFISALTDQPPFQLGGTPPGGIITGLSVLNNRMFAVTDAGGLYEILNPQSSAAELDFIATIGTPGPGSTAFQFEGLTAGPATVEGGIYSDMLFGVDSDGTLLAFDLFGALQPVFLDGALSVETGLTNINGLAFSNLDRNLWHTTNDRGLLAEVGHGINDLISDSIHGLPAGRQQAGGTSLYFGVEPNNVVGDNTSGGLAGGAHGSFETDPFSLVGYSSNDLPTLYYNYFLESQARDDLLTESPQPMLDSLRVFVYDSRNGQWELLSTNNSDKDPDPFFFNDEYDYQGYPGIADDTFVQENFNFNEGQGQWRQARINLAPYAGLSDLRLRFDFSSDGSMNLGDTLTTGSELRAVDGDTLRDGDTFTIAAFRNAADRANNITTDVNFEFDLGFTLVVPPGSQFLEGQTVTIDGPVGPPRVFTFTASLAPPPNSISFMATATTTASADLIAERLTLAIAAAGIGVNPIMNGQRINLAGATSVTNNSAILTAAFNVLVPDGSSLFDSDRITVMGPNGTRTFEFNSIASVTPGNVAVNYTFGESGQTIASRLAAAIISQNLGVRVLTDGVTVSIYEATNVTAPPANQTVGVEQEALGLNDPNAIRLLVNAGMTSNQVADVMRRGIINSLLDTPVPTETIKIYKDTVRIIGHTVTDPGPLILFNSLQGDEFGRFFGDDGLNDQTATQRRQSVYNFEGVYIDDIIIGFAERGENATGAPVNSNFIPNPTSFPDDIDLGNYQLEIRRGTDYIIGSSPVLVRDPELVMDSNDRQANKITITIPDGELLFDGQRFQLSDGVNTATFEFEDLDIPLTGNPNRGIAVGTAAVPNFAIGFRASESSHVIAARLRDLFNSTAVRNRLSITSALADGTVAGTGQGFNSEVNVFGNIVANTNGSVAPGIGVGSGGGMISEIEPNDLIDTAQSLDGESFFLVGSTDINDQNNVDVSTTIPHLSISGTGDGTFDYYSFTVGAGDTAIFDIDAGDFDSELFLYDQLGNLLAQDDDGAQLSVPTDLGSNSSLDAFLQFTFAVGGTYVIGVGEFNSNGDLGGITGNVPDAGDNYTLHVSIENKPVTPSPPLIIPGNSFNIVGTLQFEIFANINNEFLNIGDQNLPRVQGSVQITQNQITDSLNSGIVVDDNLRVAGPTNDSPVIGAPRQLPTPSLSERLTRGVKISNNVVAGFNNAGIDLIGDDNNGAGPLSSVPFHRLLNNTIYGGPTPTGTGVRISNASPTMVNNVIANTAIAIDLVGGIANSSVVANGVYQNNTANDIAGIDSRNANGQPLFVDPSTNNFYLAQDAAAIDSARDGFEDRPSIVQVFNSIGIPLSNLLAPEFDRFGQQRIDDPRVQNTGTGNKVFWDRGAVERADFEGPTSLLIVPEDIATPPATPDPTKDLDFNLNKVRLIDQAVLQFIVSLDDVGIGIDDNSVFQDVDGDNIDDLGNVVLLRDGVVLQDQVDYLFRYNANTKQVILEAVSGVFPVGDYRIVLNTGTPVALDPLGNIVTPTSNPLNFNTFPRLFPAANPPVRDLAGNSLRSNLPDGTTQYEITLEPPPRLTINDVQIVEGNDGDFPEVFFSVTLSADVGRTVTVEFDLEGAGDGTGATATEGTDFDSVITTGTLTFTPGGPMTRLIPIQLSPGDPDNTIFVIGDVLPEMSETFFVRLSNATNADIADALGVATIVDDELSLTIADTQIVEGDLGTKNMVFTVSLVNSETQLPTTATFDVLFDYTTAPDTATAGVDYLTASGTITILAGDTTATIIVPIIGDVEQEGDEKFFVNLSNSVNAAFLDNQAVGTIEDDDPKFSIDNVVVLEGDTPDVRIVQFTVSVSSEPIFPVTIDFRTQNGTAEDEDGDGDYDSQTGTVTFNPGEPLSQTISIAVNADDVQEDDEQFFVIIENPSQGTVQGLDEVEPNDSLATPQNVDNAPFGLGSEATILGSTTMPHVSINGIGDGTFDYYSFTVTDDDRAILDIDGANFDTELFLYDLNGNLLASNDNAAPDAGNTLGSESFIDHTFTTGGTYVIAVAKFDSVSLPDGFPGGIDEPNSIPPAMGDAYTLHVSIKNHALGQGVATILDDDPRITIDDVTLIEGNNGVTEYTFTVSLSSPVPVGGNQVKVDYATSLGNTIPNLPPGTIAEIEPNDSLAAAQVLNASTFGVNANANVGDQTGMDTSTTIPHVTISGRGNGTFDYFSFDGAAGSRVILDIDGASFDSQLFLFDSLGNLIASNDDGFDDGGPNGNALDAGSQSTQDAFLEFLLTTTETFTIAVGRFDSVGGAGGVTGTALGQGDVYSLNVSIENFFPPAPGVLNEVEPNNVIAMAQNLDNAGFSLANDPTIDNSSLQNISTTIPHVSINGTGDFTFDYYSFTATAGSRGIFDMDGTNFDTELFLFNAGGSLLAFNDDVGFNDNGNTFFNSSFLEFTFATTGTYVIGVGRFNSDGVQGGITGSSPRTGDVYTLHVSIENHALTGGTGGATGGPAAPDGTATPNVDFVPNVGTLTFDPGEMTKTITIQVLAEDENEPNETFFVRLSNAVNAVIEDGAGQGTIINDDAPLIFINDPVVNENDINFNVFFTVSLSKPADVLTTIDFQTVSGTAIAGQDFVGKIGTLTFQVGQQSQLVAVQLINDGVQFEGDETFSLRLSNPVGADFGDDEGVATIIDTTGFVERVSTVVAPDAGRPGEVKVLDAVDGSVRLSFDPYPGFQGGVRIATGDVDNDGIADILTVPGPGAPAFVNVYSGANGQVIRMWTAFGAFAGGAHLASGDIDRDSFADVIVAADGGGGPHVLVFSGRTGAVLSSFFPYPINYTGGVRVASGDVDGDQFDDIITAPGQNSEPFIRVFSGRTGQNVRNFLAYSPLFQQGVYVASADVNLDGFSDIITGPGAGGGPHVRVFSGAVNSPNPPVLRDFFAYHPSFTGGVRVSAARVNNDPIPDIIVAPGPGGGPHVRVIDGATVSTTLPNPAFATNASIRDLFPYENTFSGGLFVAGVDNLSGSPLRAAQTGASNSNSAALTQQALENVVDAAVDRLRSSGASASQVASLGEVQFAVANLSGDYLGLASPGVVLLDVTAAGNGWFIDPTPGQDEEFQTVAGQNGLAAVDGSAVNRIDLLSVVLHELGHQLGLSDLSPRLHPDALMTATLATGTRRLPTHDELDEAFSTEGLLDSLLLSNL